MGKRIFNYKHIDLTHYKPKAQIEILGEEILDTNTINISIDSEPNNIENYDVVGQYNDYF